MELKNGLLATSEERYRIVSCGRHLTGFKKKNTFITQCMSRLCCRCRVQGKHGCIMSPFLHPNQARKFAHVASTFSKQIESKAFRILRKLIARIDPGWNPLLATGFLWNLPPVTTHVIEQWRSQGCLQRKAGYISVSLDNLLWFFHRRQLKVWAVRNSERERRCLRFRLGLFEICSTVVFSPWFASSRRSDDQMQPYEEERKKMFQLIWVL